MNKTTALAGLMSAGIAISLLAAPAVRAGRMTPVRTASSTNTLTRDDGCERTTTTVRLTPADATTYQVAGWLCGPRAPRDGEVQFLVHGFTYNHLYWRGLGYRHLDYVRSMAARGRATFVIDQLGAGASDHPAPDTVTFPNLAYVAHQLVTGLRSGEIGRERTRFRRVIGVGHSMGAGTWIVEAGTYHDVDAVVLADLLHATDPDFVADLRTHYVLANGDPRFAGLPDGYLTVEPRSVFYDLSRADPRVVQRDEEIGIDTGAIGQVVTLAVARQIGYSQGITVPVLVVTGRQDALGCNEAKPGLSCATAAVVADREAPYYTNAACMDAYVFDAGHDTNLHRTSPVWFTFAERWIAAVRHTTAGHPSAKPGETCG